MTAIARTKPEKRRYLVRMAMAMALYLTSLFAAEVLIEERGLSGWPAYMLAALPGLAFAAVFWIFVRLIVEERDEFFRMLYVRQMMVATGLTLTAAAVWGFMETYLPVPHLAAFWWPTIWCFGTGVGAVYNKITMGSYGECR
ncbi:hypothetical protein [Erythrobacter sp. EC-HK427]|uniref:hypothetical protein n=1 Tax=Erythrobacter sp. EC-HK427 TaxID=2038396 RepID=UPI00125A69BE|nr:hypothetical protein [Erythrobacter sp. EC-HK427]VVS99950.1 conserved membrane hypothetical protein [Erythrobacter sp. EC-HK427]